MTLPNMLAVTGLQFFRDAGNRHNTPPRCRCRLVQDKMWEVDDCVSVRGTRCKALISRRLFIGIHIYPTASLRLPVNPQVCCPLCPNLCSSQCFSRVHAPLHLSMKSEHCPLFVQLENDRYIHTYIHAYEPTYTCTCIHAHIRSCVQAQVVWRLKIIRMKNGLALGVPADPPSFPASLSSLAFVTPNPNAQTTCTSIIFVG